MRTLTTNSEADLRGQLEFETLLAVLPARFINLTADRVDTAIEDAQRRVRECLRLGLSSLWQWDSASPDTPTPTNISREERRRTEGAIGVSCGFIGPPAHTRGASADGRSDSLLFYARAHARPRRRVLGWLAFAAARVRAGCRPLRDGGVGTVRR